MTKGARLQQPLYPTWAIVLRLGVPHSGPRTPQMGEAAGSPADRRWRLARSAGKEGGHMRLVKRMAVAAGSLLALVLAGGAHFRF